VAARQRRRRGADAVDGGLRELLRTRPELPGAALDDFEQAVRVLAGNDWGFRLHASYGETIDSYLAIFDVFAAGGCPNGTRWFFDHAETASQRSLERIVALGGAISVQNRTVMDCDPVVG